ncbi:MAG: sigma-54-dependent Fis family transcriptional regulator [Candidatus Latescibacterota bacterium]|nr:MAG: sigma-54-dependent Fis family transcriptional regulator [Candidatus Latescibacterota bacterium]
MKILLADDDNSLRRVVQFKLKQHGHDVTTVEDGQQALGRIKKDRWDLLLSDIRMPNVDGIELLQQARQLQPDLKVILITAYATVSQAVQAVKLGAFDYITKPFEDDELFAAIDKAAAFRKLETENKRLRGRLEQSERTGKLLGVSRPFKDMMSIVDKIAATDATVLLTGPSGTGKELVARTIHTKSTRADGDFVAINCGAIPSELVESELFGHKKGAFTGAVNDKKGKFELAEGGTILLDEVGELPNELQVKLLRVLQERVVEPVGSEELRQIDVRVIGATNADLQMRVAKGEFREDLFYRLNVIPIRVPSLADRREDIPILVKEFVDRYAPGDKVVVSRELIGRLEEYSWPGNIRELENLIERMVILRISDELSIRDLPTDFGETGIDAVGSPVADRPLHLTFHEAEEKMVREALDRCGWNRTRAAKYLDIPRHVLLYRMKKYKIEEERSRQD